VYLFTLSGFATSSGRQFLYQEVITFVSNKSFNNFTIFEVFCYPVLGKTKTYQLLVTSCPSKTAFYHSNLKLWCVQEGHRCTPKQPIRFQVSFGWAIIIRHRKDIVRTLSSRHLEEKYFCKGHPCHRFSLHFWSCQTLVWLGDIVYVNWIPCTKEVCAEGEPWDNVKTGMTEEQQRTTNIFEFWTSSNDEFRTSASFVNNSH
jgi:hypothetical protein